MLLEQEIVDGYSLVFGALLAPTPTQILYWQGVSSGGMITSVSFPAKLASHTLLTQGLLLDSEKRIAVVNRARMYLYYEPQDEVMTVEVNYEEPLLERIEFSTDVLIARSGKEQRFRMYRFPKVIIEHAIMLHHYALQSFTNKLMKVQGHSIWYPIWSKGKRLEGNTVNDWDLSGLEPGKYVLYLNHSYYEVVEVVTVGEENFFAHQLALPYNRNPLIFPVRKGWMNESINITYVSSNIAKGRVQVEFEPARMLKNPYPTPTLIEGIHVIPFQHNWVAPGQANIVRPVHILENKTGVRKVTDLHGYSDTTRTFEFLGRRGSYGIRDFFIDSAGKFGEFYCPTFTEDITVLKSFEYTVGDKVLLARDAGFANYYARSKLSKYIFVEFKTRPAIICEIELPTEAQGIERIPVKQVRGDDDPFGFDWKASEVYRISYLPKCRFATDTLEVSWINQDVYKATAAMVTIQ